MKSNIPTEETSAEPAPGLLRSFFGLFLVPLLVVLVCVAVFVGFGWIAYDQQSTADYLNDLRSGWKPRRAQAAYELAKILIADPSALDHDLAAKADLRRLFSEAEDEEMSRYLALVLGYTKDAKAIPVLAESLNGASPQTRIYLLWALGTIGDSSALPPLTAALSDTDPGIRKIGAYALGELGDVAARPALEGRLGDAVADVRWNAALALARLGVDTGVPVLREMLDRRQTARLPDITPEQQEDAMVSAIRALSAVEGDVAIELFETLATDDPNLKVRQAAIEALAAARR